MDRIWSEFVTFKPEEKKRFYFRKVASLTTGIREKQALASLDEPSFVLLSHLLNCRPPQFKKKGGLESLSQGLQEFIREKCNTSQIAAIDYSLAIKHGFSLLQGPPGTGKTHTITKLINCLHLRGFQKYYENMSARTLREFHAKNQMLQEPSKPISRVKKQPKKPRILVCAQSNAAIDEIMLRVMKDKFMDGNRVAYCPDIIRVGKSGRDEVNTRSLDLLMANYENAQSDSNYAIWLSQEIHKLMIVKEKLIFEINELGHADLVQQYIDVEEHLRRNSTEQKRLARMKIARQRIEELSKTQPDAHETIKNINRDHRTYLESSLIETAEVVFATLSGSGMDCFKNIVFDYIIIDEAAQAIEVSTIIPIQYSAKVAILVGDPQQLSATVFSTESTSYLYNKSLFERLMEGGVPVKLLNTQYRMHPSISAFPSSYFYQSKLLDGENVQSELYKKSFHEKYKPFWFYDILGRETRSGKSLKNPEEAQFALKLYERFISEFPEGKMLSIGVITPYTQQLTVLKRLFDKYQGKVEVNTVDGFQGREKDIILFSCVRTSGVGFLKDIRRLNVGLTRARFALWIIGNHSNLEGNLAWKSLIQHAQTNNCFSQVSPDHHHMKNHNKRVLQERAKEDRPLKKQKLEQQPNMQATPKPTKVEKKPKVDLVVQQQQDRKKKGNEILDFLEKKANENEKNKPKQLNRPNSGTISKPKQTQQQKTTQNKEVVPIDNTQQTTRNKPLKNLKKEIKTKEGVTSQKGNISAPKQQKQEVKPSTRIPNLADSTDEIFCQGLFPFSKSQKKNLSKDP